MDQKEANFFFRDYVTEDILSYGIGSVWVYHYKETIIGVRDLEQKIAFFVSMDSIPKEDSPFSPTLDMMTDQHVKEAVDEVDHSEEKTEYLPIFEIVLKAKEMVSGVMAKEIDKQFGITTPKD